MSRQHKINIAEFKEMWQRGVSCDVMAVHFGMSKSYVSAKAKTIPGLEKRLPGRWRASSQNAIAAGLDKDDPVALASMNHELIASIMRSKGSLRFLGTLAAKHRTPYSVVITLSQRLGFK